MKNILNIIYILFLSTTAFAQNKKHKPFIDSAAYKVWTSVERVAITNDGNYISYVINNEPLGSFTLVLKQSKGDWELKIPHAQNLQFTGNSRMALFRKSKDSLCIVKLGTSNIQEISNVHSFTVPTDGDGRWLAYKSLIDGAFFLKDLVGGKIYSYPSINSYVFNDNGTVLVLDALRKVGEREFHSLEWLDLSSMMKKVIWEGSDLTTMVLDEKSQQLAFIGADTATKCKAVWRYKKGEPKPTVLTDYSSNMIKNHLVSDDYLSFGGNGVYIFFKAKRNDDKTDKKEVYSFVNIWSYLDTKLPPQIAVDKNIESLSSLAVNISTRRIIEIAKENEIEMTSNLDHTVSLILALSGNGVQTESSWSDSAKVNYYVRTLNDDQKILLERGDADILWLSKEGRYVIFYEKSKKKFISYDIAAREYRDLIQSTNVSFVSYYANDRGVDVPRGVAGWLENDARVLIYDRYDIWLVDPKGVVAPVNLTNGFGARNNMIFYLGLSDYREAPLSKHAELILNALDLEKKRNGYFRILLDKPEDPRLLVMGNFLDQLVDNPYVPYSCKNYPTKARDKNRYVIKRMTATSAPNYFFTDDFKHFIAISNIHPEKNYNWYSTELHSWSKFDGKIMQGVLYKPENFDPSRKYPVIMNYYEKKSYRLNEFIVPEDLTAMCDINIPTYVSNEYLVFTPDIDYSMGDPMQGTYDAIVSAADYISFLPFVNKQKIGIGGCSFGGAQTNYLVTHSSLFAAAYSACSISDFVSAYGGIFGGVESFYSYFEVGGQGRMGGTLWENPQAYLKSSSIFNADKVTTPLLMMQERGDPIALFSQALELFNALRRLGKRAWLLEYTDTPTHGVSGASARDCGIRMFQFFNHYLKDQPAPFWMTKGVSATMRGLDSGLKLDTISIPGVGLVKDPILKTNEKARNTDGNVLR